MVQLRDWENHIHSLNIKGSVAIGVSGGADSMALVKLMKDIPNITVIAITVDHSLRAEAAKEAEQVNQWMNAWGIQHITLKWEDPATNRIQEKARQARYHLLSQWCYENQVPTLLTAHHLDDAIETFWMRSFKGSGLTGLCSIKQKRPLIWNSKPFGHIIRPALHLRCSELQKSLEGHPYIDDPSNTNENFERVRIRNWLKNNPDKNDSAIRSMKALQEAEDFINHEVEKLWVELAQCDAGICTFQKGWKDVAPFLRKRLWQKAVQHVGQTLYPMATHVCEQLDANLMQHKAFTAAHVLAKTSGGLAIFQHAKRNK